MNKIDNDFSNYECEKCVSNGKCINAHDNTHIYGCIGFVDKHDNSTYKNIDDKKNIIKR